VARIRNRLGIDSVVLDEAKRRFASSAALKGARDRAAWPTSCVRGNLDEASYTAFITEAGSPELLLRPREGRMLHACRNRRPMPEIPDGWREM
jgi:hypothetical protein